MEGAIILYMFYYNHLRNRLIVSWDTGTRSGKFCRRRRRQIDPRLRRARHPARPTVRSVTSVT